MLKAEFDIAAAKDLYEQLKSTPLYDPARQQWNREMSETERVISSDRTAVDQLLGVLVELKLGPVTSQSISSTVPAFPQTRRF